MRHSLKKFNKVLVFSLIVSIICGFGGATYVLASNLATQEASSAAATTITVVGKVADSAIASITFPQGSPGATISNPYNDVDTVADSQVLSGTVSEPVVRLKNTAGVPYNISLEISNWTNGIAASEDYELVGTTTTNVNLVNDVLSADGNASSVATGVLMGTGEYRALYLELVLSGVAGKVGSSTVTILGESA